MIDVSTLESRINEVQSIIGTNDYALIDSAANKLRVAARSTCNSAVRVMTPWKRVRRDLIEDFVFDDFRRAHRTILRSDSILREAMPVDDRHREITVADSIRGIEDLAVSLGVDLHSE